MKNQVLTTLLASSALLCSIPQAQALDEIGHLFRSVRSAGMGGTLLTTGMYEDNFFGNPAQVTQDPKWKLQLLGISAETSSGTLKNISKLTGGGDGNVLGKIAGNAGTNNHGTVEPVLPALYLPNFRGGRMSYAFGILAREQSDIDLRRSFQLSPQARIDGGPALTIGRKFLELDRLAVGVTGHFIYSLQAQSGFTLIDLIQGRAPVSINNAAEGGRFDFDLGTRYRLPWTFKDYEFSAGASVNNVLGGKYTTDLKLTKSTIMPTSANRALGVGVSAKKPTLWRFTDNVLAFDVTDMGNNPNGSVYRLLHMGFETHLFLLSARAGINQGYWTAGVGLDLKILQIDVASYGEEMSLNAGGLEDRRYALKVGLQI